VVADFLLVDMGLPLSALLEEDEEDEEEPEI
jgi:hypothetical protein